MDNAKIELLLKARAKSNRPFEATVQSDSMSPALFEGDVVMIQKQHDYAIGDVLVYPYYDEGVLIHRLLRKSETLLHCKGDNCYRIEEIAENQVIGKAVSVNNETSIGPHGLNLKIVCWFSSHINKIFVKHNYRIDPVVKTVSYKVFRFLYLRRRPGKAKQKKSSRE